MKISFESKGDFDDIRAWLKRVIQGTPSAALSKIAREGEISLASNTPKETGETASGWMSDITVKGHVAEVVWKNKAHPGASANVAKLIELGHGTRTGGYVAPKPYIKQSMKPVWKSTDNVVRELIK